jgi:putative ABC transport system substrate-binding protein
LIQIIKVLGGATAGWPLAARAQQPAMPVVGFLGLDSPAALQSRITGWRRGLSETGYAEGRNVAIEYRFVENQIDNRRWSPI